MADAICRDALLKRRSKPIAYLPGQPLLFAGLPNGGALFRYRIQGTRKADEADRKIEKEV
jgi:hypothetical protein